MPRAQYEHLPQEGRKLITTWSPTSTSVTPSPISVTTPAPSWPPRIGSGTGMSPVTRCSSEWHRPLATILTRTSWAFGGSSSISSTSHFWPNPHSTAALVFIALLQQDGNLASRDSLSGAGGVQGARHSVRCPLCALGTGPHLLGR